VRSRLYKKVFGHKGGAKDWDDFVLSIGAWANTYHSINIHHKASSPFFVDMMLLC
jgi:hypothetical protein